MLEVQKVPSPAQYLQVYYYFTCLVQICKVEIHISEYINSSTTPIQIHYTTQVSHCQVLLGLDFGCGYWTEARRKWDSWLMTITSIYARTLCWLGVHNWQPVSHAKKWLEEPSEKSGRKSKNSKEKSQRGKKVKEREREKKCSLETTCSLPIYKIDKRTRTHFTRHRLITYSFLFTTTQVFYLIERNSVWLIIYWEGLCWNRIFFGGAQRSMDEMWRGNCICCVSL